MWRAFLHDEAGSTTIEYGLIAGIVSVVMITALIFFGNTLNNVFNVVTAQLNTAGS